MIKRLIPVLVLLAAGTLAAPAAMAECYRCKIRSLPHMEPPSCIVVTIGPKFASCFPDDENDVCVLEGSCTTLTASKSNPKDALASEFAVASVERLDESRPTVAMVASLNH